MYIHRIKRLAKFVKIANTLMRWYMMNKIESLFQKSKIVAVGFCLLMPAIGASLLFYSISHFSVLLVFIAIFIIFSPIFLASFLWLRVDGRIDDRSRRLIEMMHKLKMCELQRETSDKIAKIKSNHYL